MRAVTLTLSSREETNRRFLKAFDGEQQGTFITFRVSRASFQGAHGQTLGAAEAYDRSGANVHS